MKLQKIIFLFSFLAMFLTLMGGYFYFSSALEMAIEKEHEKTANFVKIKKAYIASQIQARQKEAQLLADNNIVKAVLANPDSKHVSEVNSVLDMFQKDLKVSVCYIMNDQGVTIASSNRNSKTSFVGKNYRFRPYFQQSMQGKPTVYLALGVTSGKRGLYYSHPIYSGTGDKPVGVAIIKGYAEYLVDETKSIFKKGILLLHNENGLIFISSRSDWLFNFIWKPSDTVIEEMKKSLQFGRGPWPWVGMTQTDRDHAVDVAGVKYLVHQEEFEELPGWKLSYFHNLSQESAEAYGSLVKTISITVLILCLVMGGIIVILHRSAQDELKKRIKTEEEREKLIDELSTALAEIKTLRGIIPICSHCKKIRDDKGYWSQIESYVKKHSEAEFSHGICPECEEKLYSKILKRK